MPNKHAHRVRGIRGTDERLWADLDAAAKAVGSDRSTITRALWEWFVGHPDAELPKRPTDI
jgi:hypothetical protein